MKRITKKTLKNLGFKKFKRQNENYPIGNNVWYIRHFAKKSHKGYNEYHFELNEQLDTQPMSGAMGIYHQELLNIPAPTNENLNRTIDLDERTHYFAYSIRYEHQLKKLLDGLSLGQEPHWEN